MPAQYKIASSQSQTKIKCQIPGKEYREAFLRDITSEQMFQRIGIAELGTITEQTFIPRVPTEVDHSSNAFKLDNFA